MCDHWKSIIDILNGACELLGENMLTVIHSALTNLKYTDSKPHELTQLVQNAFLRCCSGWMRKVSRYDLIPRYYFSCCVYTWLCGGC